MALSVAQAGKMKTTKYTKRATTSGLLFQYEKRCKCLNSSTGQAGNIEILWERCRTSGATFMQPHDLLAPLVHLLQCLVSFVFFVHNIYDTEITS